MDKLNSVRGWRCAGVIAAGVMAVLGLTATAAVALTTYHSATRFYQFQDRTGDTAWTGAGAGWTDVPGASLPFSVPAGTSRMIQTTFTAESKCDGAGWCSARVVIARASDGVILAELRPIVGTDYAFDAPGDTYEGHGLNRTSYYWGAGNYTVKVQAARVGASGFRIDDWNFGVTTLG